MKYVFVVLVFTGACYDANSPNLPPCGAWPDPCDVADAGADAR